MNSSCTTPSRARGAARPFLRKPALFARHDLAEPLLQAELDLVAGGGLADGLAERLAYGQPVRALAGRHLRGVDREAALPR